VKGGPARGGVARQCRFYTDDTLAVAKQLFQRATGAGLQPVVINPNAGIPRALAADRAGGDTFVTVAIGQTGFYNVGDLIPIWNAANTVYRVITAITPATGRLDLDSALGVAFTVAAGTMVNATDMEGHIWGWADDATDTWMRVTELGSNRLLAPVKVASAAPTLVIAVQEEGSLVNSRATINFIGPNLLATDDGANNRINVTDTAAPRAATYVVGSADATLTAELVLGTAVIMEGTTGARPAASLAGRLYNDTTVVALYRDTGAAWTQVTPPIGANYVVGTANAALSAELELGTAVIMSGTAAARPAAALAGRLYFATDTAGGELQRDTGAAWVKVGEDETHAASHNAGGADVMAIDAAAGTGSLRTLGTAATQAAPGTVDAAAGTGSVRTLGSGATQAAAGNHTHTRTVEAKDSSSGTDVSVTWTTAFAGTPAVTVASNLAGQTDKGCDVSARSTTGASGQTEGSAAVICFLAAALT
jgi:hypothetical protein